MFKWVGCSFVQGCIRLQISDTGATTMFDFKHLQELDRPQLGRHAQVPVVPVVPVSNKLQ